MPRLRAWFSRLLGLFQKNKRDAEMTEEMQAHLDLLIERNIAAGMLPTKHETRRCDNLAESSRSKKSRANSGYGDGRTNFFKICASACECFAAIPDSRFWQFSVSHLALAQMQPP